MSLDGILMALRGSGAQLYRRNAFRITGVPTAADRKTVRRRQRQVLSALEAGADVDLGHSLPVGLEDVRAAFDQILQDPHRRLVDEVFWLWGDSASGCTCGGTLHTEHDAAVLAHCAVLDLEAMGDQLTDEELADLERRWSRAGQMWDKVLRRAGFWAHVEARVAALDERQLDEPVVAVLREQVPLVLVQPLVDLAATSPKRGARLAAQARTWPGVPAPVLDSLLEDVAASCYDDAGTAIAEVAATLGSDRPERAAALVYEQVMPQLQRLESLVPHRRHRRTARVRDRTALVLNNCATALIDRGGPDTRATAGKWLRSARELASDPQSRQIIDANQAALDEIVRALETIQRRVREMVAAGRPDLARSMLLDIKRQVTGSPLAADIDRLVTSVGRAPVRSSSVHDDLERRLTELFSATGTSYSYDDLPQQGYSQWDAIRDYLNNWWYWHRRKAGAALVAAAVAVGVYLLWSDDGETATLFAPRVVDNAAPGTCVATEDGWHDDEGKAEVPVVPCDQPHWAEVLGYPSLGTVPSPYPGQDQTVALASFECGLLLAGQQLPGNEFTTTLTYPDRASWNTGGKEFQNYATCLLHRADGSPMDRPHRNEPIARYRDMAVPMDIYNIAIADNAPVGTCVRDRPADGSDLSNLPVVRCENPHWAEILGYPWVFESGSSWPGDDAVQAAATEACRKVPGATSLHAELSLTLYWPARAWWDDPDRRIYAVCLAHRPDDQMFSGGAR